MHMSNDLWFLQQQYHQMVQSSNCAKICVLQDFNAISPFLIHKLNKITEYELWHQRLMHPGQSCMSNVEQCATGIPVLSRDPMHNCKICNEMNITKTTSKEKPLTSVTKFGIHQYKLFDNSFVHMVKKKELESSGLIKVVNWQGPHSLDRHCRKRNILLKLPVPIIRTKMALPSGLIACLPT